MTPDLSAFLIQAGRHTGGIPYHDCTAYGVNPNTLLRQVKTHNPEYQGWSLSEHAQDWLLFPENVGSYIHIDKASVSQGKLYTFITNNKGKGKQGTLLGVVKGTRSADIIALVKRLSPEKRGMVEQVSMDMAKNMEVAIRKSFSRAELVTDRFRFALLRIM